MKELRLAIGKFAGRLGILLCLFVVPARIFGFYTLFGFTTSDLLGIGVACLMIGCFELLLVQSKAH